MRIRTELSSYAARYTSRAAQLRAQATREDNTGNRYKRFAGKWWVLVLPSTASGLLPYWSMVEGLSGDWSWDISRP